MTGAAARVVLLSCLAGCSMDKLPAPHQQQTRAGSLALTEGTGAVLLVSNEDSGDISVVDVERRRVKAQIAVGKRPRGLKLSPDGKLLYVAVSGSPKAPPGTDESKLPAPDRSADGISVVELSSGKVLRTLQSGADPETFDLSADGQTAFVANEDTGQASFVSLDSGEVVRSVAVGGEPEGVTTCPDGSCVYVTSEADSAVFVIDAKDGKLLASIPTGKRPRNVVFARGGALAFVSNELGASISVIDTQKLRVTKEVTLSAPGARPMGLALSSDGNTLFVSTGRGQGVALIDTQNLTVHAEIPSVGARPWGLALSRDGKALYTANGPSHDVSIIDIESRKVVAKISVGKSPWGVVLAEPGKRVPKPATLTRKQPADELERLTEDDNQWVMVAKNYQNTRFSRLSEIKVENVSKLQVKWGYGTGLTKGHEAAPLVVGDSMYLTTPFPNRLIALDLRASPVRVRWIYDPEPNRSAQGVACCDVVNRGAAYVEGKIIYNTLDNHTVAVDAHTGKEVWKTKLGDVNRGETMTMAPLVVRDKVFVGNSGGEFGVRGWLTALDVNTGQMVWRAYGTGSDHDALIGPKFKPFYAADRGKDLGMHSWPAGKWKQGGATAWGFVSYDPLLDFIYYGTGNPGPWNPEQREGDNKWSSGVFAREPDTGEAHWFYQWAPHDEHDYDGVNENVVAELELDGKQRHVIINAGRTGYLSVLDRATGEVLSATPFVHVTSSHGVDLKTGRPLVAEERKVKTGHITRNICPASPGGKDWQPSAYDAARGILYLPANNLCQDEQGYEANYIAGTPFVGTHTRMYAGPGGHRGELIAWDVKKKQARYRIKEEFPVWSGVLATAGGIVFYGTMNGTFKAIAADTGRELWKQELGSGVIGQPITFRGPDGKQYVSVFAGVGGWSGAVVSGNLDRNDTTAALGFVGAMGDLQEKSSKGGTLYTFGLP